MEYLEEFRHRILKDDYRGFLQLWEEFCAGEEAEGKELEAILKLIHDSRMAPRFGQYAETALPLWEKIDDPELSYKVIRRILDLETTHSSHLAELALAALQQRYGEEAQYQEWIRLVGLRTHETFQGAISHYELLRHLQVGNFVYHTGGWGVGEVMALSPIREEVVLEFERVPGQKPLSFENAFTTLIPLDSDHFLARRFGDPDTLEAEARRNPVGVIQDLLKDLGDKTAAEIKDELCELVIPEKDWTKWWQAARSRIKRDTTIETPTSVREPFRLREEAVSHAEQLKGELKGKKEPTAILQTVYHFVRDFPEVLKQEQSKGEVEKTLADLLKQPDLPIPQRLEAAALSEEFLGQKQEGGIASLLSSIEDLPKTVEGVSIIALKKRILVAIRESRSDWAPLFIDLLFSLEQNSLRDYLLREVIASPEKETLENRIVRLLDHPIRGYHLFVWLFQKVMAGQSQVPMSDDRCLWLEHFLILLHQLEHVPECREMVKKMYNILIAGRFELVRKILQESSLDFAREFLLLISKCHTLSDHDQKILQSVTEVAHPKLASERAKRPSEAVEEETIWTTQEGYNKIQSRMEEIATIEMLENAKEIEEARELGDLRENAEYKCAQERRASLQSELKRLSDSLKLARVITKSDIQPGVIGVGSIITLSTEGEESRYTLLGPWDTNPEEHILSYQSKFAQAMHGLRQGETFHYQGRDYTISSVESFLDVGATR
ncbi:MAG: GreA/GreB family elongation factor [Parachlamydiales bacterium]